MKWDNNWDSKTNGAFKMVKYTYRKAHPAWAKKDKMTMLERQLKQLKVD